MARVLLLSATHPDDKHGQLELKILLQSAGCDRFRHHVLTDDPVEAEVIVFAERENAAGDALEKVRKHHYVRAFSEKCFVFNPRYKNVPLLRGIYASVPKQWSNRKRTRSSHYPEVREDGNFVYDASCAELRYLFSFAGMFWTSPVRRSLSTISSYPRGHIEDTSQTGVELRRVHEISAEGERYIQRYVRLIQESKFVLCPRGTGPSSMRLFETMLLGRVPVILSDQWVPPDGPDWDAFSLRVRESDVASIPSLLEANEERAATMGRLAREAWLTWFSEEVAFHYIVESCLDIQKNSTIPESVMRPLNELQVFRPSYLYQEYRGPVWRRIEAIRNRMCK